jgi:hopene-associated glycosyltransferase HpnB
MLSLIVLIALAGWIALCVLPWQPWSTREHLEPVNAHRPEMIERELSILIPARNEEPTIGRTISAVRQESPDVRIILVDDQSTDQTAEVASSIAGPKLTVFAGQPMPAGWIGKLWALEQGLHLVRTDWVLLLDADIELTDGMLSALWQKRRDLDLVSVMAELRMHSFWEKWLAPAFVYFFKLVYPFALGNSPKHSIGVAAGGCILVKTAQLRQLGGFEAIRDALIDDCTLAKRLKLLGSRNWIGLTHGVKSHRAYERLRDFWQMVARTAFTQLRYSRTLLIGTTVLLLLLFVGPIIGLITGDLVCRVISVTAFAIMAGLYCPVLRYYRRSLLWAFTLPLIASLFLAMTWSSAIRFWRGHRSAWKGREYRRSGGVVE